MTFKKLDKLDKVIDSKLFSISCCIIGAILGIILAFYNVDYVPATKNDYAPLIKQQEILSKEFNKIYEQENADVHIRRDHIFIVLENSQCSLKVYFDKDTDYMFSEKNDKALSIPGFIFVLIFSVIAFSCAFFLLMFVLLATLSNFLEWLHKKRRISTTADCFKDVDD